MEINHKHGGFIKGRLMMLCGAAKPSERVHQHSTNKVMTDCKQRRSVPLPASVVYFDPRVNYMDKHMHEKKPKQSADKLFSVAVDEGVDAKAASYISSVRERLKREGIVQELTS